jgi:hypothetical protein
MVEQNDSIIPEEDESRWQKDIEKKDYYYDDSTGYEVYKDDEDESEDNEDESE